MTNKDLFAFCELFYSSHYLPIAIFNKDGSNIISISSMNNRITVCPSILSLLLKTPTNPGIYSSSILGSYGVIRVNDLMVYVVIGPTFSCSITTEIVRNFMHENAIEIEKESEVRQFLAGLPQYTYNQFINLLAYLHFTLNGEIISVPTHFNITYSSFKKTIGCLHAEQTYHAKEEHYQHGTYDFEIQLLDYVRRGETEKLKAFLMDTIKSQKLQEGKLADTPLRQAKNLFIGLVTMVGKEGAIKGGLDIEQTYHLIDIYIQECERMQSVEAVKALQYNMLIDFTERVAKSKVPAGISKEIFSCIQYIRTHTNERIGVSDVANHIGKSRAYVADKFKKEMNVTIGAYIMQCKLEEAKSMLTYSNKSIAEISSYLGFSSQSYFQNVFKKYFGTTPAKYRKQTAI